MLDINKLIGFSINKFSDELFKELTLQDPVSSEISQTSNEANLYNALYTNISTSLLSHLTQTTLIGNIAPFSILKVTSDTQAPTATITDDDVTYSNSDMTFTFHFSEAVNGFDFSDIILSAGITDSTKFTKIDDNTYILVVHSPDNGTNGEITVDINTGSFTDISGNANVADTLADTQTYTAAGSTIIDLGEYGKLIAPVHIDNNGDGKTDAWFYYWDRSGDGTSANTGSLNDSVDYTTHSVLDGLFNHDINGITNVTVTNAYGNFGTTNDYRYGEINGIKLALPTVDDGRNYIDAHSYPTDGMPADWQDYGYWTATPDTIDTSAYSYIGYIYHNNNNFLDYVALQVL